MKLTRAYVRFFRSFNFDYERKAHPDATPHPWEYIGTSWYPFVSVDIDSEVTAIVGANESGKSHLIAAIMRGLRASVEVRRRDFCRYSEQHSVETGELRKPDVGVQVEIQDARDVEALAEALEVAPGDRLTVLRLGDDRVLLIVNDGEPKDLEPQDSATIFDVLPRPFELKTNVPLPSSISIKTLLGGPATSKAERLRLARITELAQEVDPEGEMTESAKQELTTLSTVVRASKAEEESADLARDLITHVAKIASVSLEELQEELAAGEDGSASGLLERMNHSLEKHLNFTRWWSQDKDFQLRLASRGAELALVIRDRTGSEYTFAERSRGLTYFLSYFVQLLAYERDETRRDVLLMDEPDAYLSSAGQHDLLRALEYFARPDGGAAPGQVIYVTHSPFLINRNAGHRIRVLDKGSDEEGTRVVRDVAQNHYEPLRSSMGAYVAETAFISGANLIVEGISDQVLLASAAGLLRRRPDASPSELLDLNEVTLVPAGSASNIPYMAYVARGRDATKPACVALLDGDQSGREAAAQLARATDGQSTRVLADEHVVLLDRWGEAHASELTLEESARVIEIEDLLPAQLVVAAAQRYARHLLNVPAEQAGEYDLARFRRELCADGPDRGRIWATAKRLFAELFDAELGKTGFAKEIAEAVDEGASDLPRPHGFPAFEANFSALLRTLSERLDNAVEAEADRLSERRAKRLVKNFLSDHGTGVTRDETSRLLRSIENGLEDTLGDEAVRRKLQGLRRDHDLATNPLEPVADFFALEETLRNLPTIRRQAYAVHAQRG